MLRSGLLALVLAGLIFAAWLPANRVVAQAKSDLLQKVETRLGRPLSGEQRQQFTRAATSLNDALLPPKLKFAETIAQFFKLPLAEVQAVIPAIGINSAGLGRDTIPRLEARIGRSLTPQELQQVRTADNAKKADMNEIQAQFVPRLAQITGLSKEQLLQLLPI